MNDEAPLPAIHSDPCILGGVSVFVGSRLPIATLLACVDAGNDWNRLVGSWPFLTLAHVQAARTYSGSRPPPRAGAQGSAGG